MNRTNITNYKKLYIHVDSYHWGVKSSYFSLIVKFAGQYNLRVVHGEKKDNEKGLYIKIVDKDEGFFDTSDLNPSQINIFHISEDFEPYSSKLYYDMVYSNIPSNQNFVKGILKVLANKDKSIQFFNKVHDFENALKNGHVDEADQRIDEIGQQEIGPVGLVDYLKGRLALKKKNPNDCFMHLYDAYTKAPTNPVFIYEMQSFFIFSNLKENALNLCVKYAQKFPRCQNVIRRGIELSIATKQAENLDLFFDSARRGSSINKRISNVYNAGLSVYIRFLVREGKHLAAVNYAALMAKSTVDEIFWSKPLDELIRDLPIKHWSKLLENSEIKLLLLRLYPMEAGLIVEHVERGIEASVESCFVLEKSGKGLGKRLKMLMKNIRAADYR